LFYFIWTTATHAPYRSPEFPTERVNEIVPNDEAAEHARRQRFAADDLAWLESQLRQRFQNQQFLVVGFGDHHPYTTGPYYSNERAAHARPFEPEEDRYKTYYRVQGVNFAPLYAGLPDLAEIGFLSEIILQAADLPAGRSMLVRRWLRERCGGKWSECPDQLAVSAANHLLTSGDAALFVNRVGSTK
jgi:hypothetical protein